MKNEFTESIKPLLSSLERYVLTICHDSDDAKDIISDSLYIAYTNYDKIKDRQSLLSYLFTVSYRLNLKKRKKTELKKEYEHDIISFYKKDNLTPEEIFMVNELYDAIALLKPKYRDVITTFDLMGFNLKETAEILNVTVATVKIRLYRGRKILAKMLDAENDLNMIWSK